MAKRQAIRKPAPVKPTLSAAPASPAQARSSSHWQLPPLAVLGLILVCTCVTYYPALSGGILWDDEAHITKPELRSLEGLSQIWFQLGATQQYYPLLHTSFWVQSQLWGNNTFYYHLVNLLLHLAAVCLVYANLRKLQIPGALLAAAIFALHPVHVETVAWITEQKNTLSAVFYLGTMLAYLHFDERRAASWYALALVLFALGLLSKTVTATLPAAMLVIFWWQRGTLSWKRDVVPLLPFFALGAAFGILTAWVEKKYIGAEGADFELSLIESGLLAGRVIWFYLGKLLWPTNLIFIYPRWTVSAGALWQWLFPLAAIVATVLFWALRKKSRAPLAAWLFFVGTLFPVLGFFNVFPFMFSFVADHFQYLASLGIIVFVAGATTWGLARRPKPQRGIGYATCVGVVGILAVLTARQVPIYADAETLYRATIDRNPDCWMAYNNLGGELFRRGPAYLMEATQYFQDSLRLNPGYSAALNNLGAAMLRAGRLPEAVEYCSQALKARPNYANAHCNLGSSLFKLGRTDEAVEHLKTAVELEPRNADAHNSLGAVLVDLDRPQEALAHLEMALRLSPNSAEVHCNLGRLMLNAGRVSQALDHLNEAVRLQPDSPESNFTLADALLKAGQPQRAIERYRVALKLKPDFPLAHSNLGAALHATGNIPEAMEHFQEAVRLKPDYPEARNNLGALLRQLGRPQEAIEQLHECLRLRPNSPDALFNLGNTLFDLGRIQEAADNYAQAVKVKPEAPESWAGLARADSQLNRPEEAAAAARKALELARNQGKADLAQEIQGWFSAGDTAPSPALGSPPDQQPAANSNPASNPPSPALPPPIPGK